MSLSAEDHWPTHPRKEAEDALREARTLGWLFRSAGHFGTIKCPIEGHQTCSLQIYSTSGDKEGSVTAKKIRAKVRACSKLGGQDPLISTAGIGHAVEEIGHLVDAAELLRESDDSQREADALIDTAEGLSAEDQDAALELAVRFEEDSDSLEAQAWTAAIQGGVGTDWPPSERATELAKAASDRLDELLEGLDLTDLDGEISTRVVDLRQRLEGFHL